MLKIDEKKLIALLTDFYKLTGVKVCVFDDEEKELAYVPIKYSSFCAYARSNVACNARCVESDKRAFSVCKSTLKPYVYTCHMGLTECFCPIVQNGRCIAYVVIGQIRDKTRTFDENSVAKYGLCVKNLKTYYEECDEASIEKIEALTSIASALTSYIYLNKLVSVEQSLTAQIEKYIEENIDGDLSVDTMCMEFSLSRVDLYGVFKNAFFSSPARYVKERRLIRASELLKSTDYPVATIAEKSGLYDYNYFSKLFKSRFNCSPSKWRRG